MANISFSITSKMNKQRRKKKGSYLKKKYNNTFLIVIKVAGSTGPIRFVVNRDDSVEDVIKNALDHYAREGRLPVFDYNRDCFYLCPTHPSFLFKALNPEDKIGSTGVRMFSLYKKQKGCRDNMAEEMKDHMKRNLWREWLHF